MIDEIFTEKMNSFLYLYNNINKLITTVNTLTYNSKNTLFEKRFS